MHPDKAPYELRVYQDSDRDAVVALLDACMGVGFWDPEGDLLHTALVAVCDDRVVGVATASIGESGLPAVESSAAMGTVRLVAVEPSMRRRGIATALVRGISESLESQGAGGLVAYAWVHGRAGSAPLASSLEASGFAFERRLPDFYADFAGPRCPACHSSPCECPSDLYIRDPRIVR